MSLPLTTQPTLPINDHLINLHVMSLTIKLKFLCKHNYLLFCIEIIQTLNLFQSHYLFLYIFLSCFITKILHEMHIILRIIFHARVPIIASILTFTSIPSNSQYSNIRSIKIRMSWLLADQSKKKML